MSRIITQSLEGNIMHAFSLANEFVKVCPEDIWGMKFGGWPVWQQIFHPFASVDFFLRGVNEHAELPLFEDGVAEFKKSPLEPPARLLIKEYMEKTQERVQKYIAGLDDTALAAKHEGLSSRFGRDMTQAAALSLIAAHVMYHLGACDAALREQGRPGVF
jgi:hypothetical protein